MEKKAKELHYKRAVLRGVKTTLQHALEGVLKEFTLPFDRLEMLGLNNDESRLILHERHHKAILCSTMASYEKGALQPIMGIMSDSANWPIQLTKPPKLEGAKTTEFLDGYLFLGVWKNHVIFLPSRSCTSEHLEEYLNWLLRKKAHWPLDALVTLDDRPPQEVRDKKFEHVKAMTFNATLGSQVVTTQAAAQQPPEQKAAKAKQKSVETVQFKPAGASWNALKDFLAQFGGQLPEDLLMDSDFDPNDVSVKIEVSCAKRKLEKAGPLMDVMANALRHVETDVVKIQFADGTELKGADLKTRKKFTFDCQGSMPVVQQVDKAIEAYLQELIDQGTVTKDD